MTGHWRLSLLITVSCLAACVRRRYACANVTVRPAIVPDGNVDGNAHDRPRRRTEHSSGAATWTFEPVNRHEPADIYRHDPIAEPVAADDRDGYERHHSVEPAARPHQHHRQLSVSSRLHRDDAQRWHGRSHEYRRRFLWRRLCVPGAVDIPWPRRVVKDRIIAVPIDRAAPLTFLRTAFHEDDWVAVFLKSYQSGRVAQRVRPVQQIQSAKFQAWLRAENAAGANVYVSVNTVGTTSAIAAPRFRPRDSTCLPGR